MTFESAHSWDWDKLKLVVDVCEAALFWNETFCCLFAMFDRQCHSKFAYALRAYEIIFLGEVTCGSLH